MICELLFSKYIEFRYRKEYDIKINLSTKICNKISENLKQIKDFNGNNKMVIYVSTIRPNNIYPHFLNKHMHISSQIVNAYITDVQYIENTKNKIKDYIRDDVQRICCFNVPSWIHRKKKFLYKIELQLMSKEEKFFYRIMN